MIDIRKNIEIGKRTYITDDWNVTVGYDHSVCEYQGCGYFDLPFDYSVRSKYTLTLSVDITHTPGETSLAKDKAAAQLHNTLYYDTLTELLKLRSTVITGSRQDTLDMLNRLIDDYSQA